MACQKAIALSTAETKIYRQAQVFVEANKYSQALNALAKIQEASPQVIYMRAQILLALQDFYSAEKAFLDLVAYQGWQSLAWYYLAGIAQSQERIDLAIGYHQNVVQANQSDRLVDKSRTALEMLQPESIKEYSSWSAQLFVESIWSELQETNEVANSAIQDMGVAATGVVNYDLQNQRVFAFAYDRQQSDLISFELTQFGIGYEYDWHKQHSSQVDSYMVDSDAAQYTTWRVRHRYQPMIQWINRIDFGLAQFIADSDYEYLDGTRYSILLSGALSEQQFWRYSIYKDDRQDLDNFSYSPLVNEVSWLYQHRLNIQQWLLTEIWYQNQQWPSSNGRHAHGLGIQMNYEYPIRQQLKLSLSTSYERYREYDTLSFDETTLSIGAGLRLIF